MTPTVLGMAPGTEQSQADPTDLLVLPQKRGHEFVGGGAPDFRERYPGATERQTEGPRIEGETLADDTGPSSPRTAASITSQYDRIAVLN